MDPDRQWSRSVVGERAIVQVDVRREAQRTPADDREHERQLVPRRSHDRLRTAADTDPRRESPGLGWRIDMFRVQRCPRRTVPRYRRAGAIPLENRGEHLELLLEQRLVLVEAVAEKRERLREGAAAQNDFGAAVRHGVEGGEALKDANRVVRAEHRDRGAKPNAARATGDRGEDDLGRRDGEVGAVVLADADEVDAQLVGEHGLVDDVAKDLGVRKRAALGVDGDVAERVQPELDMWCHGNLQLNGSMNAGDFEPRRPYRLIRHEAIRFQPTSGLRRTYCQSGHTPPVRL